MLTSRLATPRMVPRRWIAPFILLLSFVSASGCQDPVSPEPGGGPHPGYALAGNDVDVTLGVEAEAFEPGEPATLVLENVSGEAVGYNLCFHTLERRDDDEWVMLEFLRMCTAHLDTLVPGANDTYETLLEFPSPGKYRFRIAVLLMDRGVYRDLVSDSFVLGG